MFDRVLLIFCSNLHIFFACKCPTETNHYFGRLRCQGPKNSPGLGKCCKLSVVCGGKTARSEAHSKQNRVTSSQENRQDLDVGKAVVGINIHKLEVTRHETYSDGFVGTMHCRYHATSHKEYLCSPISDQPIPPVSCFGSHGDELPMKQKQILRSGKTNKNGTFIYIYIHIMIEFL